jgi:hypothetical protein
MKDFTKILLGIGVGVAIGYYIKKNKTLVAPAPAEIKTIKKGDLSKEVEELQNLINRLFGTEVVEVTGAYDKKTGEVVKIIFYDTKELSNIELGEVSVESIKLLNKILDNIQTKTDE